jgi:hypothetical protein
LVSRPNVMGLFQQKKTIRTYCTELIMRFSGVLSEQ